MELGINLVGQVLVVPAVYDNMLQFGRSWGINVGHGANVVTAGLNIIAEGIVARNAVFVGSGAGHLVLHEVVQILVVNVRHHYVRIHIQLDPLTAAHSAAVYIERREPVCPLPPYTQIVYSHHGIAHNGIVWFRLVGFVLHLIDVSGTEYQAASGVQHSRTHDITILFTLLYIAVHQTHGQVVCKILAPFTGKHSHTKAELLVVVYIQQGSHLAHSMPGLVLCETALAVECAHSHHGCGVCGGITFAPLIEGGRLQAESQRVLLGTLFPCLLGVENRISYHIHANGIEILPADIILGSPSQHYAVAIGTCKQMDMAVILAWHLPFLAYVGRIQNSIPRLQNHSVSHLVLTQVRQFFVIFFGCFRNYSIRVCNCRSGQWQFCGMSHAVKSQSAHGHETCRNCYQCFISYHHTLYICYAICLFIV